MEDRGKRKRTEARCIPEPFLTSSQSILGYAVPRKQHEMRGKKNHRRAFIFMACLDLLSIDRNICIAIKISKCNIVPRSKAFS